MSTITVGSRVQVNANYGEGYPDTDGTISATLGEQGTVTGIDALYVEVRMDNEELRMDWGPHLFNASEVDVVEAHPL